MPNSKNRESNLIEENTYKRTIEQTRKAKPKLKRLQKQGLKQRKISKVDKRSLKKSTEKLLHAYLPTDQPAILIDQHNEYIQYETEKTEGNDISSSSSSLLRTHYDFSSFIPEAEQPSATSYTKKIYISLLMEMIMYRRKYF